MVSGYGVGLHCNLIKFGCSNGTLIDDFDSLRV